MRYILLLLPTIALSVYPCSGQLAAPLDSPLNVEQSLLSSSPASACDDLPSEPRVAAIDQYVWFPPVFRNRDARIFPFVPYRFPVTPEKPDTIEWRGIGQIFAPSYCHAFYSGSVYNDTSNIYYDTTGGGPSDQDYIDQFLDRGAFTIDSLQLFVYENALAGRGNFGGKVVIMKTATDFSDPLYRTSGYAQLRQDLPVVWEQIMTPEVLDAASRSVDTIVATRIRIPSSANLRFAEGESVVALYVNDDAPAVGPDNVPADADVQQLSTQLEFREGSFVDSTLRDQLEAHKSLGVVLLRDRSGTETVLSGFKNLTYQGVAGVFDLVMVFWGTVETKAGVNYHFGSPAAGTTLGAPAPNPVLTHTRIPFTMVARSRATIDLFDAAGRHVRSLVDDDLPAGSWSVDVITDDLPNGLYVVRMVVGDRMLTRTLVVAPH